MAPLSRSRTIDSAVSVTPMCCSTSASTAGAKNATTFGCIGARLCSSARVGAATTSGETCTGG